MQLLSLKPLSIIFKVQILILLSACCMQPHETYPGTMKGPCTASIGLLVSSSVLFTAATDLSDSPPAEATSIFASVDIVPGPAQHSGREAALIRPFRPSLQTRGNTLSNILFSSTTLYQLNTAPYVSLSLFLSSMCEACKRARLHFVSSGIHHRHHSISKPESHSSQFFLKQSN